MAKEEAATHGDPITEEVVELARDGYRMFRENDPAFLDRLDPEIEWHVPDTLPDGGDLHGHLEVLVAHVTQYRNGKLVYFRNYMDAAKALQSLEEPPSG